MKKLIKGIVEFRAKLNPEKREAFAKLALGQSPDALFVACSDSRVAPNAFASTDPGDVFVIRNVGNLIPPCGQHGVSISDESELAALEFALLSLKVKDIIVCGHSECGAIHALYSGREKVHSPHLKSWLVHGQEALEDFQNGKRIAPHLSPQNEISQLNVLRQLEHLKTYEIVRERMQSGALKIHAWWFDISNADVYSYSEEKKKFVVIDEKEASHILSSLE